MYKVLTIGGRDYKFEYSLEASLYNDCVEQIITYFKKLYMAETTASISDNASEEEKEKAYERSIKESIFAIGSIPKLALTLWYAGFMEHNGDVVRSFDDAKKLYKVYAEENPDESSMYEIIAICMNQMEEDGFFHMIGLDKMFTQPVPKTPQDHKKKVTSKRSVKS